MRKLLTILMILALPFLTTDAFWIGQTIAPPVVTPPPTGCNTLTGLTCDANGWTIITAQAGACEGFACTPTGGFAGTRIIYVSSSTGCDNGVAGCTNDGSWAQPAATTAFAMSHMRGGGSPDWMLLKCGDTWFNQGADLVQHIIGNDARGISATLPILVASYDGTTDNKIPDPASCPGGRAIFTNDSSTPFGNDCFSAGANFALLGIVCTCPARDPSSVSFLVAQSQTGCGGNITFFENSGTMLIEDVVISFGGGLGDQTRTYPNLGTGWPSNIAIRRNEIFDDYIQVCMFCGEGSGILWTAVQASLGNIFFENLISHNPWSQATFTADGGGTITWSDPTVFNHNVYIPGASVNGDDASQGAPIVFSNNIMTGEGSGSAFRTNGNFDDNLFMHNARALPYHQPNVFTSSMQNNVFVDGTATSAGGASAIEVLSRYINEAITVGGTLIHNNIIANAPGDPNAVGIQGGDTGLMGQNGNTVTGNVLYNWGYNIPSNDFPGWGAGGICSLAIVTGGTGYTDNSVTLTGAQSSTSATLGSGGTITARIDNGTPGTAGNVLTVTSASANQLSNSAVISGTGVNLGSTVADPINIGPGGGTGFGGTGTYYIGGGFGVVVQATGNTFTSGTGSVTLNLASALSVGDIISVAGITATGSPTDIAKIEGFPFTITAVSGTTITYIATAAIGASISGINGGNIGVAAQNVPSTTMTATPVTFNDQQGYVIASTGSQMTSGNIAGGGSVNPTFPSTGPIYMPAVSGVSAGIHQASQIDNGHIIIYGTAYSSSFTGTAYMSTSNLPNFIEDKINLAGSATGSGGQAFIFPVSGVITATFLLGADAPGETEASAGVSYLGTDTLSYNGTGGTGATFTPTLCNNTTSPNTFDPTGTNMAGWSDPARQPGAYYATGGSGGNTWSVTANTTFTGVIDVNGTLTVTSQSGAALSLGDAIKWSGQTKNDYIAGNSTTGSSLCTGGTCTGTGSNTGGTYALSGQNKTVGSISMSAYSTEQLISLQKQQSKQSWNPLLTSCNVNNWFRDGFGLSHTTCPAGG